MQIYKDIRGKPGQPIARLTPLGWTCVGAFNDTHPTSVTTHFARTYFVHSQVVTEDVDTVLRQFWEVDNGGMDITSTLTTEERIAVGMVDNSIGFCGGCYQVAIPWKEKRLFLPDNYKIAFQRLQNLLN